MLLPQQGQEQADITSSWCLGLRWAGGRRRPAWGSAARSEDSLLAGLRVGVTRPLCRAPLLPPNPRFLASLSAPPEAQSLWAGWELTYLPTGPFTDEETETW